MSRYYKKRKCEINYINIFPTDYEKNIYYFGMSNDDIVLDLNKKLKIMPPNYSLKYSRLMLQDVGTCKIKKKVIKTENATIIPYYFLVKILDFPIIANKKDILVYIRMSPVGFNTIKELVGALKNKRGTLRISFFSLVKPIFVGNCCSLITDPDRLNKFMTIDKIFQHIEPLSANSYNSYDIHHDDTKYDKYVYTFERINKKSPWKCYYSSMNLYSDAIDRLHNKVHFGYNSSYISDIFLDVISNEESSEESKKELESIEDSKLIEDLEDDLFLII